MLKMEVTFIDKEGDSMNSFDDFRGLEEIEIAYAKDEDYPLDNYLTINLLDEEIKVIDDKAEFKINIRPEDIKIDDNSLYDFFHRITTLLNENGMGRYQLVDNLKFNIGDRLELFI
jgi:hypothetical protein